MRQSILILLGLALWAGPARSNVIFKAGFEPARPVSGQVVISPGFKLLTTMGETAALSAAVIDEAGGAVPAEIHWHSNDPATVSVSQEGTITALQAFGSAQIIASAPGALSAIVLVTIATPAAGALLVPDERVVEPPAPVDPMAPYGLGYQYTIVLQGIPTPVAGDILIGTGETPLAGRVVAASADMGQVTVTLEVIALDELFATLVIDERLNLERAPIEVDPAVEEFFDVTRYDDGSIVLSPLAGAGKVAAALESLLDCGDSSIPNPLNILTVSAGGDLLIDPSISVDLSYNSLSGHFGLSGSGGVTAVMELAPRATIAFEGKLSCQLKLAQLIIPIGGPLAWIFSGQIPLGVGFELSGKVTTTEPVGYDLTATGSTTFNAGVSCQPSCTLDSDLDSSFDGAARLAVPTLDALLGTFELDLNGLLFAFASLQFGNPLLAALQFEALKVEAGLQQSGAFRSVHAQSTDPNFASNFKLDLVGSAGAGSGIAKFLELLTITPPSFNLFSIVLPLAQSPVGTLVITDPSGGSSATPGNPASVQPGNASELGELATFEVSLNPTTYLGLYSVEGVDIYWLRPDGLGGTTLEPGRPGCNSMNANEGQTVFTCQTDFTDEHLGTQTFYAFVRASLFGVEVPFPLEIAADSTANLTVTSDSVTDSYFSSVRVGALTESLEGCGDLDLQTDVLPGANEHASSEASPGSLRALADTRFTEGPFPIGSGTSNARGETRAQVRFPNDGSPLEFIIMLDTAVVPGAPTDDTGRAEMQIDIAAGGLDLTGTAYFCTSIDSEHPCSERDTETSGILAGYEGGPLNIQFGPVTNIAAFHRVNVDLRVSATQGYSLDASLMFPSFGAGCSPPAPD